MRIHADYVGQSGFGDIRTLSHEQDFAKWEIVGTQFGPFDHKSFAEC